MDVKKDILATLAYFDMFDYPLKKRELFIFLQRSYEASVFEEGLSTLIDESFVYEIENFISLQNNFSLAARRLKGNNKAELLLKKASFAAKLISKFPYVRGVAISGSLSKNFADDSADIDFFIITAKHRLWIARTWLHAFKKITFLFNRQHFFCMNYFIDETQLEIIEKNIYTATEIVTLVPLFGSEVFEKFYNANGWTKDFLPNHFLRVSSSKEIKGNWIKSFLEFALDNKPGNFFETWFMKLTTRSWNEKTRKHKLNNNGVVMSITSSTYYAKPNPMNFQNKLLSHYENKVENIFENYEELTKLTLGGR